MKECFNIFITLLTIKTILRKIKSLTSNQSPSHLVKCQLSDLKDCPAVSEGHCLLIIVIKFFFIDNIYFNIRFKST